MGHAGGWTQFPLMRQITNPVFIPQGRRGKIQLRKTFVVFLKMNLLKPTEYVTNSRPLQRVNKSPKHRLKLGLFYRSHSRKHVFDVLIDDAQENALILEVRHEI